MQFQVGDMAVYPAHGVGKIEAIEKMEIEGKEYTYYLLRIMDSDLVIRVPIENADSIGMRPIISEDTIQRVYDVLRDRSTPPDNQTWNRRYREYMNKIKTGDPIEVAKVLRDLAIMKMEKNLSFGEKKMYDTSKTLLVQELSVAKGADEAAIEAELDALFKADPNAPPKKRKKKK